MAAQPGRRFWFPLVVLAVVALAQGVAWSVATAPLNGPDKVAHAAYDGTSPRPGTALEERRHRLDLTEMGVALGGSTWPIIGHARARPTWTRVDRSPRSSSACPRARANGSGPNSAAGNPPLYYAYAAVAYKLRPTAAAGPAVAMRFATVLLLPLTVVLSWLIAAELFASALPRVVTAGLVALQPSSATWRD